MTLTNFNSKPQPILIIFISNVGKILSLGNTFHSHGKALLYFFFKFSLSNPKTNLFHFLIPCHFSLFPLYLSFYFLSANWHSNSPLHSRPSLLFLISLLLYNISHPSTTPIFPESHPLSFYILFLTLIFLLSI